MKFLSLVFMVVALCGSFAFGQTMHWSTHIDTSTTFSSPRAARLNLDAVLDIVIGGGLDGSPEARGVNAIDGATGSVLWSFPTDDEMFGSAQFEDITGDGIMDVFIGGRYAEFYAINGSTGAMIWEFFPHPSTEALDSGWMNFYSPQFIPDQNSDTYPDILVTNGGNHAAPPWDTLRPPGMLMVLDALTGNILAMDTMPDGEETYCSPIVVDISGTTYVVFGSGGENDGGALWKVPLTDLMANDISGATILVSHPDKGFIAPMSVADFTFDGVLDIVSQGYDGTIRAFNGSTNALLWEVTNPGTESSAAPVIADFIGDKTPDVFAVLAKGAAPSFFDYYQVLVDGATGQIAWKDSIAALHFASANALDLDLNGRDEAIVSLNYHDGSSFSHQLLSIDFQNDIVAPIYGQQAGVNLGSTPLLADLDMNGIVDIVYAYRADSVNPMGANGFNIHRLEDAHTIPGVGIAWGGYMGTLWDGEYNFEGVACGSIGVNLTSNNITCNGFADGTAQTAPTGGVEPYNYLWSTGEITSNIGPLDIGTYQVIVTDSTGCYASASVNIFDPYVITMGGISSLNCPGDSTATATVNSSGCPCMFSGCLFNWTTGDSTKTASGMWAGWHYITITHTDGCIVVDSVEIAEPYPIVDSITVLDAICATDTVGTGMITLHLHDSINTTVAWQLGSSDAFIDSLMAGSYAVHISDTRGCEAEDTISVTVPDTIQVTATVSNVLCFGDSTGQIVGGATGGLGPFIYQWSNGPTGSTNVGVPMGYYDLQVTDSVGCQGWMDSIMVSEPPALVSSTQYWHDSTGNCAGAGLVVPAGGTPGYTYLWSDPMSQTGSMATGLCDSTYTVVVTDANGCQTVDTVIIYNTLSVPDSPNELIRFYPNPAADQITFVLPAAHRLERLSLWNAIGQVVHVEPVSGMAGLSLDISAFARGTYLIRFESEGQATQVSRLIVR